MNAKCIKAFRGQLDPKNIVGVYFASTPSRPRYYTVKVVRTVETPDGMKAVSTFPLDSLNEVIGLLVKAKEYVEIQDPAFSPPKRKRR